MKYFWTSCLSVLFKGKANQDNESSNSSQLMWTAVYVHKISVSLCSSFMSKTGWWVKFLWKCLIHLNTSTSFFGSVIRCKKTKLWTRWWTVDLMSLPARARQSWSPADSSGQWTVIAWSRTNLWCSSSALGLQMERKDPRHGHVGD